MVIGVDLLVVGTGAGRRVEIRLRLVQVVHDRRLPLELDLGHVLGEREHLAHAVAVVVVRDVLAPVHQRRPLLAGLLAVVVGVDLLLAAVHLDDRRDEGDDVVANLLDERRLLHHQPIRQLLQHLRTAVLGRVHAARDLVDRLRRLQQLLRLRLGGLPRVGQLREHVLVFRQLLDRRFVGDREQRPCRGPPRSCRATTSARDRRPCRSPRDSDGCLSHTSARRACPTMRPWNLSGVGTVSEAGR